MCQWKKIESHIEARRNYVIVTDIVTERYAIVLIDSMGHLPKDFRLTNTEYNKYADPRTVTHWMHLDELCVPD